MYDSLPNYCFGCLFILLGIIFIIICCRSYKNERLDSKRTLYVTIGCFYFLWFIVPFLTIFIGDGFDPWSRDIAMSAINITWTTIAYTMMIGLMWPKWAHQYFNLTIGDTQERILNSVSVKIGHNIQSNKTDDIKKSGAAYKILDEERL